MPANGKTSISQDDYLERIWELIQRKGYARIVDLAADLGVRQASASIMVKRLAQANLLKREPYRGFMLTASGRARARHVHERHQVLAAFFAAIGVSPATAAKDIDGIEHHLSPKTVDSLKRATRILKSA